MSENLKLASEPLLINVGCGDFPMTGYVNIDLYVEREDVLKADFRQLSYQNAEEVQAIHVLEHLPWADALPSLKLFHSWLRPGGKAVVEVPDMVQLMAVGTRHPQWYEFVYGCQLHPGEFHMAGFSAAELQALMLQAGFSDVVIKIYASEHPARRNFPCIEATGHA